MSLIYHFGYFLDYDKQFMPARAVAWPAMGLLVLIRTPSGQQAGEQLLTNHLGLIVVPNLASSAGSLMLSRAALMQNAPFMCLSISSWDSLTPLTS